LQRLLTSHHRQALLFSATVTPEIKRVASATLNASHLFISTVSDAEAATHESVPQTYTLIPRSRQFAGVSALLARIATAPTGPGKVIVFCSTAREAEMWHMVVEAAFDAQGLSKKFPLWAIHSRLSQPKRDKAVAAFRDTTGGVMFASDVLARGIDIKGVTHVLQVGIASDAQQCMFRLILCAFHDADR
jgi:ATP-dependent RNA helicase MSS116